MAPTPPTLLESLLLLPNIGRTIFVFFLRLVTRSFISGAKQKNAIKDAFYTALRYNLKISTIAQEQWLLGTTESSYKQICWRNGVKGDTGFLKSGVKIHWIGNRDAKKTVLFFHGGGYVLAASPGHWQFIIDLQKWLAKDGHDVAIITLEYTRAPEMQYPGQLGEATEFLEYVLTDLKKKPSDIFISGDSAGGNLGAALLSHILHPHPQLKNISKLVTEPFAGAIFISPWVQWMPSGGSAEALSGSDIVTEATGRRWSTAIRGKSQSDNYQEPALAPTPWFEGLPKIVKSILVWGGGAEALIDSIVRFGELVKSVHPNTELVVQPGSGHEDFITCRTGHIPLGDDHAKLIKSWIEARL